MAARGARLDDARRRPDRRGLHPGTHSARVGGDARARGDPRGHRAVGAGLWKGPGVLHGAAVAHQPIHAGGCAHGGPHLGREPSCRGCGHAEGSRAPVRRGAEGGPAFQGARHGRGHQLRTGRHVPGRLLEAREHARRGRARVPGGRWLRRRVRGDLRRGGCQDGQHDPHGRRGPRVGALRGALRGAARRRGCRRGEGDGG
mmetsp:Transcript_30152/g.96210  ORF Transcript_30152/g.96210 Transcript_30152/m.96210 type:complete len:201 (-) Transcript_30152:292-894(-)